jgi:hypothetical protein
MLPAHENLAFREGDMFCHIRGYLSTCRQQDVTATQAKACF